MDNYKDVETIILIADQRIKSVPIKENGEVLIDIGMYPEFITSSKRRANLHRGLVRASVAEKLRVAAQKLSQYDLRIIIEEGYRSLVLQKEYFEKYFF